ncbi:MAG: four helix bundle protein [Saprospiraceae bacterium]
MFLKLAHTNLDVYKYSYALTLQAYKVAKILPADERFNLVSQIRRAALSVHLNIAEGSSRKSIVDRKRFYEIARGSLIEVDTAIGVAFGIDYVTPDQIDKLGEVIINTFKVLSGLINKRIAGNE